MDVGNEETIAKKMAFNNMEEVKPQININNEMRETLFMDASNQNNEIIYRWMKYDHIDCTNLLDENFIQINFCSS
jgi:hypothetical protein